MATSLKQISMGITPNYAPKKTVGEGLANLILTGIDAVNTIDKQQKAQELEEEQKDKEASLIMLNDYKLKFKNAKNDSNFANMTSDQQKSFIDDFKNKNQEIYSTMTRSHQQSADGSLIDGGYNIANQTMNAENARLADEVVDSFVSGSDSGTTQEHMDAVIESVRPLAPNGFDTTVLRQKIQKGIVNNQSADIIADAGRMSDAELKAKYQIYGSIADRNITSELDNSVKKSRLDFSIKTGLSQMKSVSQIIKENPQATKKDIETHIDNTVGSLVVKAYESGSPKAMKQAIEFASVYARPVPDLENIYGLMNASKNSNPDTVLSKYNLYKATKDYYTYSDDVKNKMDGISIAAEVHGLDLATGQGVADAVKLVEEKKNVKPVKITKELMEGTKVPWLQTKSISEKNLITDLANGYMRYFDNDVEASIEFANNKIEENGGTDGLWKVSPNKAIQDLVKSHYSPTGRPENAEITYLSNNLWNANGNIVSTTDLQKVAVKRKAINESKNAIVISSLKDVDSMRIIGNTAQGKANKLDAVKIKEYVVSKTNEITKNIPNLEFSDKDKTLIYKAVTDQLKNNTYDIEGNLIDKENPFSLKVEELSKITKKVIDKNQDNSNNYQFIEEFMIDDAGRIFNQERKKKIMPDDSARNEAENTSAIVDNMHKTIMTSSTEQMSDDEIEQFRETQTGKTIELNNSDKNKFEEQTYIKAQEGVDTIEENLIQMSDDLVKVVGPERAKQFMSGVVKYKDELISYMQNDSITGTLSKEVNYKTVEAQTTQNISDIADSLEATSGNFKSATVIKDLTRLKNDFINFIKTDNTGSLTDGSEVKGRSSLFEKKKKEIEDSMFRIENTVGSIKDKNVQKIVMNDIKKLKNNMISTLENQSIRGTLETEDGFYNKNGKKMDMIEILFPANVRALFSDITGINSKNTRTADYFTKGEISELKRIVTNTSSFKKGLKKGSIDYKNDYTDKLDDVQLSSSLTGRNSSTDEFTIKTTLGAATWRVNKNGELIVEDQYNFNDAEKYQKMYPTNADKMKHIAGLLVQLPTDKVGMYGVIRRAAALYGSKNKEGAKFVINLGKIQ